MPHIGNHVDAIFLPESVNTSTTLRINGGDLHLDDGKKALFGQSDDLQIYHDSLISYISDQGTGALRILASDVRIRNAADNEEIATFAQNGAVTLFYDNSEKIVTTSTGISVTGSVIADGLSLGDNETASFGDDDDFQIYHEGLESIIKDDGPGPLKLLTNKLQVKNSGDAAMIAEFKSGVNGVDLYYDNFKKFETTSTGATVTGTALATALSTGAAGTGINISTDTITGPATLTIDPAAIGDDTGLVVIKGNFQVDGTTTTINSTTMTVDDLNLTLASGAANSAAADGAGITIDGASKSLTWVDSSQSFKFSTRLGIGSGTSLSANLRLSKDMGRESVTTYYGLLNNGKVQPDVTGAAYYNFVEVKTDGNSGTGYTISSLEAYTASVGSIHADSTITDFIGFNVKDSWTSGTNNYGFRGEIDSASSTNRWNVYMDGTAPNYFAGNVGIGTTSPSQKLDVQGTGYFNVVNTNSANDYKNAGSAIQTRGYGGRGILLGANSSQVPYIQTSYIDTDTQGTTELLINPEGGNVGIGTDSPEAPLQVVGSVCFGADGPQENTGYQAEIRSGGNCTLKLQSGASNTTYLGFGTTSDALKNNISLYNVTGALKFNVNSQTRQTILANGNVGIGVTDPKEILQVSGEIVQSSNNALMGNLYFDSGWKYVGNGSGGALKWHADHMQFITAANNTSGADASASPSTSMVLTPTGNLGIGTTGPDRKLHVNGDTRLDGIVQIGDGTTTAYQLNIETVDSGNNDNTRHGARLDINGWKNDQGARYGMLIDIDTTATDNLSTNRSKYGLYIPYNTYVPENAGVDAGDDSTHNANYYGQYIQLTLDDNPVSTYNAGKANQVYGYRSRVRMDHGGGAIDVRGIYSQIQAANDFNSTSNTIDNAYAAYNYIVNDSDTTTFTAAYGTYSWVNQDNNGTMTDAYGVYSKVDRDAGTGTNAYGLYSAIEGTWTGLKYGVYSEGETSNYFSGNVGLNVENADINARLHIRSASTHLTYGIHYQNTDDQGKPDALALTNMYDRDIGITFRTGDSNGANQAKRWTIYNDGNVSTASNNNRFNISPGAGDPANGLTILQNNNVGISTAAPTEKLHVAGNLKVEGTAPQIKLAETGVTGNPSWWLVQDAGNLSFRNNNTTPYPFRIITKGTNSDTTDYVSFGGDTIQDALKLTAHGTTATYLDLKGNSANARMRYFEDSTERWNIGYDTSNNGFTFYDTQSASVRLTLKDGGNVGIGTTSPLAKLHVYGAGALIDPAGNTTAGDQYDSMVIGNRPAGDAYASLSFKNGANFSSKIDATQNFWSVWTNKNSQQGDRIEVNWGSSGATSEVVKLRPGGTDVLTAKGDGNVGIGTTTVARGPLHIHHASTGDTQIHMTNSETGTSSTDGFTIFTGGSTGSHSGFVNREADARIRFLMHPSGGSSVTDQMVLLSNGNLGLGISDPTDRLHINNGKILLEGAVLNSAADAYAIKSMATIDTVNRDKAFNLRLETEMADSGTTSADREQGGIYNFITNDATGGDTADEHRVYGVWNELTNNGDADLVYGTYNNINTYHSTGTITSLAGTHNNVQVRDAGNINNLYANYSLVQPTTGSTGSITKLVGVRGRANIAGTSSVTVENQYGVWGNIDNDANVVASGIVSCFYGSYDTVGDITTPYGIYIGPDASISHYLRGALGVGNADSPKRYTNFGALHIGHETTAELQNDIVFGKRVTTAQTNLPRIGHCDVLGAGINNDIGICATSSGGSIALFTGNGAEGYGGSTNELRMIIESGGNVGINTNNPAQKFEVYTGTYNKVYIGGYDDAADGDRHRFGIYRQATVGGVVDDNAPCFHVNQFGATYSRGSVAAGRTRTDANTPTNIYAHGPHALDCFSGVTDNAEQYRTRFFIKAWDGGDTGDRRAAYFVDSTSDTVAADYDLHQRFSLAANGLLNTRYHVWAGRVESDESSPNSVYQTAETGLYAYVTDANHQTRAIARDGQDTADVFRAEVDDNIKFEVRANGEIRADNGTIASPADYAEMFEWTDGNPDNEDRRGRAVVLVGEKMRLATSEDSPSSILGIVSANPVILGDAAPLTWKDQFLKDEFGDYVTEDVNYLVWVNEYHYDTTQPKRLINKVVDSAEDGTLIYEEVMSHPKVRATQPDPANPKTWFKGDRCKLSEVANRNDIPQWAIDQNIVVTSQRQVTNPNYDPTKPYIPRTERQEWDAVGLVGKLVMRKGEPTGDRWIKLSDLSDTLERWLVR